MNFYLQYGRSIDNYFVQTILVCNPPFQLSCHCDGLIILSIIDEMKKKPVRHIYTR